MLSPAGFVSAYAQIGAKKCTNSAARLFLAAVLAGFFIAAGAVAASTASCGLDNASVARVVSGLLFPFGLIMVYLGNFEGAASLAGAMAYSGALSSGALAAYTIRAAAGKCVLPFGQAVVLGILCNILVCAGAMCSLCGQTVTGRAAGAFVPVCFFIIGGFEHCVANMYYIPAGILAAGLPGGGELAQAAGADLSALGLAGLLRNLIPVTIGNVIGGCGFGALIWAVHRPAEG